ncbi:MAG: hypothetical protein AAF086_04300 [Planctomycetota bacterium]
MPGKSRITATQCLVLFVIFFAIFVSFAWLHGQSTNRHQNFNSQEWTLERIAELWWLWLPLPTSGACLALAIIRGKNQNNKQSVAIWLLLGLIAISVFLAYRFSRTMHS